MFKMPSNPYCSGILCFECKTSPLKFFPKFEIKLNVVGWNYVTLHPFELNLYFIPLWFLNLLGETTKSCGLVQKVNSPVKELLFCEKEVSISHDILFSSIYFLFLCWVISGRTVTTGHTEQETHKE